MWSIAFFTLVAVSSFKDTVALDVVETNTKYAVVSPRGNVTFTCKISRQLQYCRMEIPGFSEAKSLSPGLVEGDIRYAGEGLDKGVCGLNITGVQEKNNGQIKCTLGAHNHASEYSASMTLIVARTPSPPDVKILPPTTSLDNLREGNSVSFECTSHKGRPVANLTWFIGNNPITSGLSSPLIEKEENDFYTISQNLTRSLQASDSGKELKCVVNHMTLGPNTPYISRPIMLRVQFPPKPWEKAHEQLGLVEGQENRVTVSVQSNPKPTFVWKVGDEVLYEGYPDPENKYQVVRTVNKEGDIWTTELKINNLSKEDVQKTYWLKASNILGDQGYDIYLSTNNEPRRDSAKVIIFLFIAIVIVSLIALAVFARAKGLWCFAGDALLSGIRQIESSDTESMNHRPGEVKGKKDTKPKISVRAIFKKKWDQKSSETNKPSSNGIGDADPEAQKPETPNIAVISPEAPKEQKKENDNIVYAELTLPVTSSPGTRPRVEDKTEYAEIIHS